MKASSTVLRGVRGGDAPILPDKNLQLLHRHCHDEKTALDLKEIRKKDHSRFLEKLSQFWDKFDWEWINDIPNFIGQAVRKFDLTNEQHTE